MWQLFRAARMQSSFADMRHPSPPAAAPGAKKWASERWAGTADMEGGSSARVAELLEAVPRSVSAPMRALTAALPPK
jgi:hypothetical protein